MQNQRAALRSVLVLVLAASGLLLTGCRHSRSNARPPDYKTAPPPAAPSTASTAGAGMHSRFPNRIGGEGASGCNPPVVPLACDPAIAAEVAATVQRFGLRSIRGSQLTLDALARLNAAYAKFPRAALRDLEVVFEDLANGPVADDPTCTGLWTPLDARGQNIWNTEQRGARVVAGRIWYFTVGVQLTDPLFSHEVGHHLTLFVDSAFGTELARSLGFGIRPANFRDPALALQQAEVDTRGVRYQSYVSDYAETNFYEDMAELISYHVSGRQEFAGDKRIHRWFNTPPAARSLLMQRLGCGA